MLPAGVPFSRASMTKCLELLEKESSKPRALILGRGCGEQRISEENSMGFEWVYLDHELQHMIPAEEFRPPQDVPFIVGDFTSEELWDQIPNGSFSLIMFDWSTAKFFSTPNWKIVLRKMLDKLKKHRDSRFVFENRTHMVAVNKEEVEVDDAFPFKLWGVPGYFPQKYYVNSDLAAKDWCLEHFLQFQIKKGKFPFQKNEHYYFKCSGPK